MTLRMLSNYIAMIFVFFAGHPWKHHGHILLDSFHLLHPRKVSTFSPHHPNKYPQHHQLYDHKREGAKLSGFCTYLQQRHDQVCGSARPRHGPPWCCSHQDERQRARLSQVLSGNTFVMYLPVNQVGGGWVGICILVVR